jgi:HTH-type transcriptional regulator/antitoxin HipB
MSRRKKFSGTQLRSLRKEAGYTQGELAFRVGISRETVSAIENEKPETMNAIGVEVISNWWSVCRQKASAQTRDSFFSTVMEYFGFNHG